MYVYTCALLKDKLRNKNTIRYLHSLSLQQRGIYLLGKLMRIKGIINACIYNILIYYLHFHVSYKTKYYLKN